MYRGVNGILICYSITDLISFNNVKQWIGEVERYATNDTVSVIVGCKRDLTEEIAVPSEIAKVLLCFFITK